MKKFLLLFALSLMAGLFVLLIPKTSPADAICIKSGFPPTPLCKSDEYCVDSAGKKCIIEEAMYTDACSCKKLDTPPEAPAPGTDPFPAAPAPKGGAAPAAGDKCPVGEIETAVGCIQYDPPTAFAAWLLKFGIGIGGGIAFLLMLFGVFQIITSGGNPDRLKAGQELITSALMGLLMIIFSVFLLQLIGVKILDLPGFGPK